MSLPNMVHPELKTVLLQDISGQKRPPPPCLILRKATKFAAGNRTFIIEYLDNSITSRPAAPAPEGRGRAKSASRAYNQQLPPGRLERHSFFGEAGALCEALFYRQRSLTKTRTSSPSKTNTLRQRSIPARGAPAQSLTTYPHPPKRSASSVRPLI